MIFQTTKQLWENIQENNQCKHTSKTACLGARFPKKTNSLLSTDGHTGNTSPDGFSHHPHVKSGYTPTLQRHGSAKSLHWTFGGEKPDHREHTGMWQADDGHQLSFHASGKITTTTHTPPIFSIDHSGFCNGHPLLTICFPLERYQQKQQPTPLLSCP